MPVVSAVCNDVGTVNLSEGSSRLPGTMQTAGAHAQERSSLFLKLLAHASRARWHLTMSLPPNDLNFEAESTAATGEAYLFRKQKSDLVNMKPGAPEPLT